MRILVIIHEYPPVGGGGGRVAQDICRGLANLGHDVRVLTAYMEGLPREENTDGFRVIRVPSLRKEAFTAGLVAMSGFVVRGVLTGLQYVRKWRPDVVHVHFAVPAGPVAWVTSRLTGIPYVLTVHLGDVPGGVPKKTHKWFRWFFPFTPRIWQDAALVVAVSEFTRQLALSHYPVPIRVIPNGVDLNDLDPGEIRVGEPAHILFAGRFMPQKNPMQLVRTLSELQSFPWKCTMLGDGPLRAEVEREIAKSGLDDRFSLPGWVTPEEVIACMKNSDLLFMPSLSEGLPVVGVQSIAMGLAIVASRIGGFTDLVDQGENGYLIMADDARGFTKALEELLADKLRLQRFREASRRKARNFDLRCVVSAYENIFVEAVEQG